MRILSAFISSFVFASAVLEHPMLVARAEGMPMRIDDWAGVQKYIPLANTGVVILTAKFTVPELPNRAAHGSAFVGITLGYTVASGSLGDNNQQCSPPSLSIGVLMEMTSGGAKYTSVHQWDTLDMNLHLGAIEAGEEILTLIIAAGQVPVLAMNIKRTDSSVWIVPLGSMSGERPCGWFAEWKVGRIIKNYADHQPLPEFGTVVFEDAYLMHTITGISPAGLRGPDASFPSIWRSDSRVVEVVEVAGSDGSTFQIR